MVYMLAPFMFNLPLNWDWYYLCLFTKCLEMNLVPLAKGKLMWSLKLLSICYNLEIRNKPYHLDLFPEVCFLYNNRQTKKQLNYKLGQHSYPTQYHSSSIRYHHSIQPHQWLPKFILFWFSECYSQWMQWRNEKIVCCSMVNSNVIQ